MADIVGFGDEGVYIALATGGGSFGPASLKLAGFAPSAGGWSSNDLYPRELADVNLDGKIDIVGFGEAGVYVAPGNGDGSFKPALRRFALLHSWRRRLDRSGRLPRLLADVNGDGAADIVGFGQTGVWEALSRTASTWSDGNASSQPPCQPARLAATAPVRGRDRAGQAQKALRPRRRLPRTSGKFIAASL